MLLVDGVGARRSGQRGRPQRFAATVVLGMLAVLGGCAWTERLDDGVAALERSRGSIDANTAVASQSVHQIAELRSSVESLGGMQASVSRMATLLGSMDRLGALDHQLEAVAQLGPALTRVGSLNTALDRLAALAPALDAVSHLDRVLGDEGGFGGLRSELAGLRQPLVELSQLREAIHGLAALRDDLRAVAALHESMAQLGTLAKPMDSLASQSRWLQPGVLVVLALGWGMLTMVATMTGVFLGQRLGRR